MKPTKPIVLALALIAAATLVPVSGPAQGSLRFCLLCGERSVADAFLNILLFAPLGMALKALPQRRVVLVGCLVSGSIELLQFFLPGRFPSPSDVLFNSLGTLAGAGLARRAPALLHPGPRYAEIAGRGALGAAVAVLAVAGLMLRPALPRTVYWGQWTPEFANLEHYHGRVQGVRLGTILIPDAPNEYSSQLRTDFLQGVPLDVSVRAGRPPQMLAPIFNIYDENQQEVLLIGANRADLVLHYRMRAAVFRLNRPELYVPGALRDVREGDLLQLQLRRTTRGFCAIVNGVPACPLGFTPGASWGLLASPGLVPKAVHDTLNFVWLVLLFAPAGFWITRPVGALGAAAVALAALAVIPRLVGFLPTPPAEYLAALGGFVLGWIIQRLTNFRAPSARRAWGRGGRTGWIGARE
jgi:hypothetical protein